MESESLIFWLALIFLFIGVGASVVYYFARYYVKTGEHDKELLTKKPLDLVKEKLPESTAIALPRKGLDDALSNTKESLWGRLSRLTFSNELNSELKDSIEEILYTSDLGPQTAEQMLVSVTNKLSRSERKDLSAVQTALRSEMQSAFASAAPPGDLFDKMASLAKPVVWMVVGVNGAGKTTSIGKLASLAKARNLKTLIVAGDTFRAAADSQLREWANRAGCEIFSPENVKDPSAVAYAGYERAKTQGMDLVIVDTAGRLHTQSHLMEELKKMKRVLGKIDESAPHERLLVIDANVGQNALVQARDFGQAVDLSGVIITKLDGSSKAGVAIGIASELKVPILYVGIGEAVDDLRPFDAKKFIEAII